MLSIGKLAPGRADYYLDTVARGAEEYYTGSGERPGQWLGRGAEQLGLTGEADGIRLRWILNGRGPNGRKLIAKQGRDRMPAFDCTFNAPKSVSLLFALGSAEVRRHISEAQDAAVEAALTVYEKEACRVRRGRGGLTVLPADGFVAAAFRHRTSRSGDPHLHTHVVVANLAHASSDDRWTALDGRQIFAWCRTVGFLYESHLRAELTKRLGLNWTTVENGIADVAGVPRRLMDHFSTRRREIEDRLADVGYLGPRAAQLAAYATRKEKDTSVPYRDLQKWWVQRMTKLGYDTASISNVLDVTERHEPTLAEHQSDRLYERFEGPGGLTRHRSTFDRRAVLRALAEANPAGLSTDEVQEIADDFLASSHVIPVVGDVAGRIRRADGRTAPIPTQGYDYTTPDMLEAERMLLTLVLQRRGEQAGLANPGPLERAIAEATLSDEQAAMVRRICQSGDGVEVVPGVAGSGKTHALAAARRAWEESERTVIGAAQMARTARRLEEGSGIPSMTLAKLEQDMTRYDGIAIGPDHVIVVDEAAMVGTRAMNRLVERIHRARAKVVLIGDAGQLPEIAAGGAFAGIAHRTDPATLTTNRRQHHAWERQALADLREGNGRQAIGNYVAHDRVHVDRDQPGNITQQMVDQWWQKVDAEVEVLMLAAQRATVADLNRRARAKMIAGGRLAGDQVNLGCHEFAVGDVVLGLRNNYRIGILNGTLGTITAIDQERRQLKIDSTDDGTLHVPFRYAEDGHLTHGYAMTIHKAQGATVDQALVLVDETVSREAIYTAMSRGRHRNDMYLAIDDGRAEIAHAPELVRDPIEVLVAGVDRSTAQEMAIERTRSLGFD